VHDQIHYFVVWGRCSALGFFRFGHIRRGDVS
jgi:hypothetical protein